jgi:hypothetical protein
MSHLLNSDTYQLLLEHNPLLWGLMFLNEHLRNKPAEFHKEILQAALKYRKLAVVAPREHAKSSILSFLYVMHCIYYNKKKFIVMFSDTKSKAMNFLDRIRIELKENEILGMTYGKAEFVKDSEYELVFNFPGRDKIRISSRGEDGIGHIRGEIKGAYRPDLMIFDDVEYQELVDSPERRLKLKQDFRQAALPAGDIETCQYIAIGTILHFDALIAELVDKDKYTDWHKLFYRAVLDEATEQVLWQDRVPFSYLMQLKKDDPVTFAKEYMNNPISGENATFKPDNFRYWKVEGNGYNLYDKYGAVTTKGAFSNCLPAIACDLAWSTKKTADETALVACLLDPHSNILVHTCLHERGMRPERFAELLFQLVQNLHALTGTRPTVGLEKAMLERVTQHLLKNEMRKRNEFFIIKPLKWEADKISRITINLEARYATNTIYHQHGMGHLEDQLIQFPYAPHDDVADALSGCVSLLKYPKTAKGQPTAPSDDPMFDWVRNNMLGKKDTSSKRLGNFLLGKKRKEDRVKASTSFLAK